VKPGVSLGSSRAQAKTRRGERPLPGVVCVLGGVLASEGQNLLFRVDHPQPPVPARFALALIGVGDADGDGVPDLAVRYRDRTVVSRVHGHPVTAPRPGHAWE
jgi:hypothetical protein